MICPISKYFLEITKKRAFLGTFFLVIHLSSLTTFVEFLTTLLFIVENQVDNVNWQQEEAEQGKIFHKYFMITSLCILLTRRREEEVCFSSFDGVCFDFRRYGF